MRAVMIAVGAAALIATGCACDAAIDLSKTQSASPRSVTQSASQATPKQWASVIAGLQRSVDEQVETLESSRCSPVDLDVLCGIETLTSSLVAQTVQVTLDGAVNQGGPRFIGEPPAEVAHLVSDVRGAVDRFVAAAEDRQRQSCDEHPSSCPAIWLQVTVAMSSLQSVIDAWRRTCNRNSPVGKGFLPATRRIGRKAHDSLQ